MTVVVFNLGNCRSIKLNSKSGDSSGERVLRQYRIVSPARFSYTPSNYVLSVSTSCHMGESTFLRFLECSKLEHYEDGRSEMKGGEPMGLNPKIRGIRQKIKAVNHKLETDKADPKNSDRALWASLAVADFADVTGQGGYIEEDPETILGDLLAGLMHWAEAQKTSLKLEASVDFEDALDRARNHYTEERDYEREER